AAVGQQLTGVGERDDAVAQQAPALLRMTGHDVGGFAIRRVGRRARRLVRALHDLLLGYTAEVAYPVCPWLSPGQYAPAKSMCGARQFSHDTCDTAFARFA